MEPTTYTASVVCTVAGMHDADLNPNTLAAWRKDGLLKMDEPDQTGWTRYTPADLLRVCALAEISRLGLTFIGRNAKGERSTLLLDKLEEALREQMGLDRQRTPPSKKARYLIADQTLTSGKPGSLGMGDPVPFEGLRYHFLARIPDENHEAAATIVIDVVKLAERVRHRIAAAGVDFPGVERKS